MQKTDIIRLAKKTCQTHGLVGYEHIILGIIETESSFNPFASRYEPHYRWLYKPEEFYGEYSSSVETEIVFQKTSIGLMQLMGANYRELGYQPPLPKLFADIDSQLFYGVKFFKTLFERYGNIADAVSAYNQGNPAKKQDGSYVNQRYVDTVLMNAYYFKEEANVP